MIPLPVGRKSAYAARNRNALIEAAQQILAEIGPALTIEDVAIRADMAVSTVYKHFVNREQLVNVALIAGMSDWESWAQQFSSETQDPLQSLVIPMRLFIKMNRTHPNYAQMAINSDRALANLLPVLSEGLAKHIRSLDASGTLAVPNIDASLANLSACLLAAFKVAVLDNDETLAQNQLRSALSLVGINAETAEKLMAAPMPKTVELEN